MARKELQNWFPDPEFTPTGLLHVYSILKNSQEVNKHEDRSSNV
jgi:hypothetical protein